MDKVCGNVSHILLRVFDYADNEKYKPCAI